MHRLRETIALGRARVDGGARHADDRELGGDEDAVEEDETRDDEESRHSTSSVCAGGGRTSNDATASPSTASTTMSMPSIVSCSPGAGTLPSDLGMNVPMVSPAPFHPAPSTCAAWSTPHRSRQAHAAVWQEDRSGWRFLELVGYTANQFGDDILQRDQALDDAIVADDEDLVGALLAHISQESIGGEAVVHFRDRPQERRQRPPCLTLALGAADEIQHDVLGVEDADDVVGPLTVDRQPAVGTRGDLAENFRERRRHFDCRKACPWNHQLARRAQPQPERLVQPHLLLRLEQSAVAALGNEKFDFFGRVHVAMAGVLQGA